MSKPKTPSVDALIFENESEKIYFSFPMFKTSKEKLSKDACMEDKFVFLLRQAYSTNKMLDFLKGFKAESVESVITGINFLVRYGVLWEQHENKNLINVFYRALNDLFDEDENKYVPYAMYITKGLLQEQKKGLLTICVPDNILERYNKTKELWEKESGKTE